MINRIIFFALIATLISENASGFDEADSHPRITRRAISSSAFNNYLNLNLSWSAGYDTEITETLDNATIKKPVLAWLRDGSSQEDKPLCRAGNHFHNPLMLWNESSVNDFKLQNIWCGTVWGTLFSNVTWATGYLAPPPNGDKANLYYDPYLDPPAPNNWDSARIYYYKALTKTDTETRETNFAKTFQAVGMVMHLLEDMAVPAHVRNDFTSHLIFSGVST